MENLEKTHPVRAHFGGSKADPRTELPVAVMDSGVGGLCVLREIRRLLPCEELLYFGDSAFAPYGERDAAQLAAHILQEAERLLAESKALVLACNTATALVAEEMPETMSPRMVSCTALVMARPGSMGIRQAATQASTSKRLVN